MAKQSVKAVFFDIDGTLAAAKSHKGGGSQAEGERNFLYFVHGTASVGGRGGEYSAGA